MYEKQIMHAGPQIIGTKSKEMYDHMVQCRGIGSRPVFKLPNQWSPLSAATAYAIPFVHIAKCNETKNTHMAYFESFSNGKAKATANRTSPP
jgi:hypothetical protein